MSELRTHSTRVVRDLERGVRMALSYRGKPVAELVPLANPHAPSPLDALARAQKVAAGRPDHPKAVASYLKKRGRDRAEWSARR